MLAVGFALVTLLEAAKQGIPTASHRYKLLLPFIIILIPTNSRVTTKIVKTK